MNNITIHGRLTRDPELKSYTNGKGEQGQIAKFTVAVDRRIGDETDFFDCVAYGKRAEVIDKFFSKGKEIVVSGEMQCNKYTAKDGTNRYPWQLAMNSFDFCGSKKDSDNTDSNGNALPETMEAVNDDVPF
jgi:single-strand DNA-binding protein